jgi:hypothetical protein
MILQTRSLGRMRVVLHKGTDRSGQLIKRRGLPVS